MNKVKCRKCGYSNPENLKKCLRCDTSLELHLSQRIADKILPFFSKKKKEVPLISTITRVDDDNVFPFISDKSKTYFFAKLLGKGGYCNVYLVEEEKNRTLFAVKMLRLWEISTKDRESVETRFWFEFQMAQTKSEYLVGAFDRGLMQGNPFYVMEFCEGGALTNYIGTNLSNIKLIKIASDILKGLNDLHKEHAVHRDLKPNNVVFHKGQAKLIDFGISGRNNVRITRKTEVLGTDVYMAPEWFDTEKKDIFTKKPTVDIFSFGVLLFEILTGGYYPYGTPPDSASSVNDYHSRLGEYFQKVLNNLWENLTYFKENNIISTFWVEIIEKCLLADPLMRFQSANEILAILNAVDINKYCVNCNHEIKSKRELFCESCGSYLLNGSIGLRTLVGKETNTCFYLNDIIINKGIVLIGRKTNIETQENDIAIADLDNMLTISRYHATIEFSVKTGIWFIRDGQWRTNNEGQSVWHLSTNGIYVNAIKVDSMGLAIFPDDIISIGNTTLKVEFTPYLDL